MSGALCSCGVRLAAIDDSGPFLSLERHLGIGEHERVQSEHQLTMTFGGVQHAPNPDGTTVVRRFRTILEVSWQGPTVEHDQRWNDVFILHYRGPLSGPPWGPVPALRRLRELRDCTPLLYEALLRDPPPELRSLELHTPVASASAVVATARSFPALQFLVLHFSDAEAGLVLTDELLERNAWLDCRTLERGTSVFALRR